MRGEGAGEGGSQTMWTGTTRRRRRLRRNSSGSGGARRKGIGRRRPPRLPNPRALLRQPTRTAAQPLLSPVASRSKGIRGFTSDWGEERGFTPLILWRRRAASSCLRRPRRSSSSSTVARLLFSLPAIIDRRESRWALLWKLPQLGQQRLV